VCLNEGGDGISERTISALVIMLSTASSSFIISQQQQQQQQVQLTHRHQWTTE